MAKCKAVMGSAVKGLITSCHCSLALLFHFFRFPGIRAHCRLFRNAESCVFNLFHTYACTK